MTCRRAAAIPGATDAMSQRFAAASGLRLLTGAIAVTLFATLSSACAHRGAAVEARTVPASKVPGVAFPPTILPSAAHAIFGDSVVVRDSVPVPRFTRTRTNVRTGPGISFAVAFTLDAGSQLFVRDLDSTWVRVFRTAGTKMPVGYVLASLLDSAARVSRTTSGPSPSSTVGSTGRQATEGKLPCTVNEIFCRQYRINYDACRLFEADVYKEKRTRDAALAAQQVGQEFRSGPAREGAVAGCLAALLRRQSAYSFPSRE